MNKVYPIVKDNRFNGHLIADYDYETKKTVIKYNARKLAKWPVSLIISGVFHEIGHVLQGDMPYETEEEKIVCECGAEKYSIEAMKLYYPKKYLDEVIQFMKRKMNKPRWRKMYPVHFKAFSQIEEY